MFWISDTLFFSRTLFLNLFFLYTIRFLFFPLPKSPSLFPFSPLSWIISITFCLAKKRNFNWPYILSNTPFYPLHSESSASTFSLYISVNSREAYFYTIPEAALNKVSSDLYVAKRTGHSSVLVLLDLSRTFNTTDCFLKHFHLLSSMRNCFSTYRSLYFSLLLVSPP